MVIREATEGANMLSPWLWLFVGSEDKPVTRNLTHKPGLLERSWFVTAILSEFLSEKPTG